MPTRTVPVLTGLLLAAAIAGCSSPAGRSVGDGAGRPPGIQPVARHQVAAPAPARLTPVPPPGTIGRTDGPFDDRYQLVRPSLRDGVVQATVRVTADVSGLIVLEVQGDFYDARGALLGSVRSAYSEGEGGTADTPRHAETDGVPVTVRAADAWRSKVSSVVLSVPVLVNE